MTIINFCGDYFEAARMILWIIRAPLKALVRVALLMTDFNENISINFLIKELRNKCPLTPLLWMFNIKAVISMKRIESIIEWWDLDFWCKYLYGLSTPKMKEL